MTNKYLLQKFSVDDALDSVDLTFPNYTPSKESLEFFNLIRIFMGKDFEVPNPKFHYFLVDLLYGNVTKEMFPYSQEVIDTININYSMISILASRGTAKSSIVSLFYPIIAAIKGTTPITGPLSHILILSDSQKGGARDQALLMGNAFERSKFAKEWFEKIRFTETEVEVIRKGDTPVEQRHMLIKFKGASTGGVRSGSRNVITGDRYAIILADDVIKNEADSYSETIMSNVKTALESDALNAMRAKNTQMVIINTPFHKYDPLYSATESGGYTPLVIPICKELHIDLKEEEFVGVWDMMHSYDSVMKRYANAVANKSTRSLNQELMLRVSNEEDRMVSDDMIQWFDRNLIMKMIDGYSLYITTDFTTTSAAKSDFSALAVWAVGSNKDMFLLDLCVRRQELQEQYNELFRMVSMWSRGGRYIEVGVEIDGQQKAHIFSLKEMMQKKNMYFSFAKQLGAPYGREGILSRGAAGGKLERFRYILPMFQNMKIHFADQLKDTQDMKDALKQLKGVTLAGFSDKDDFIDVVSQLGMIDILIPTATEDYTQIPNGESDNSMWFNYTEDKDEYKNSIVF